MVVMGNNCCHNPNGLRPSVDLELGLDGFPTPPSQMRSGRPMDPNHKMKEFYELMKQMQLDNLGKLRDQLKNQPEKFLLNLLTLSVTFFDNFDR